MNFDLIVEPGAGHRPRETWNDTSGSETYDTMMH